MKTRCCINVMPIIPENYIGTITFPPVFKISENQGDILATQYTGPLSLINFKPERSEYQFKGTAGSDNVTLEITSNPGFFSHIYKCGVSWEARCPEYGKLAFLVNGDYFDCLEVSFSGKDCDISIQDITYTPEISLCDPCEDETC